MLREDIVLVLGTHIPLGFSLKTIIYKLSEWKNQNTIRRKERWIPAFAGMTRKETPAFAGVTRKGNDKKKE